MVIKKYIITQEQLEQSNFRPVIDLPLHAYVLYIKVNDNDDIELYVEQREDTELFATEIAFVETGVNVSELHEKKMYHNFSIEYKNKLYHVYY